MTSEELANNKLEKLRKNDSLTFPLDSFKILRSAGVFIQVVAFIQDQVVEHIMVLENHI